MRWVDRMSARSGMGRYTHLDERAEWVGLPTRRRRPATYVPVMSTHVETLVIGAGQAGLSAAYHLTRRGRGCVVVDRNDRVGDNWRHQWDSLHLYSSAKYDGLPGMPFPAHRKHYPSKDEVADFLETYARELDLPVQLQTRVQRLTAHGDGFRAETDRGVYDCDDVVVATGTFGRTPHVPDVARDLDPRIRQLHSSEYRRPTQLAVGPTLVVGASHSGFDIAYELAADRPTILVGPDCGQFPVRLDTWRGRAGFAVLWFVGGHVLNRDTPMGRRAVDHARFHGGPALRIKRTDLAERGVERVTEHVTGVRDGLPMDARGRVYEVANVVWATGFRQVLDWIELPIFAETGWPREERGVVTEAPGLYFTGLSFQYSFRSMLVGGAGADAEFVVRHLLARRGGRVAA